MLRLSLLIALFILGSAGPAPGFQISSLGNFRWRRKVGGGCDHCRPLGTMPVLNSMHDRCIAALDSNPHFYLEESSQRSRKSRGASFRFVVDKRLSHLIARGSAGGDNSTSSTGRVRSVLTKVFDAITYPVRAVTKRLRWKRQEAETAHNSDAPSIVQVDEPVAVNEVKIVSDETLHVAEAEPVSVASLTGSKDATKSMNKGLRVSPVGDRRAEAAPGVDLSGNWTILVSDEFRKEYDEYLKQLGQPFIVRSVALTIIPLTTEVTQQSENGRALLIRGTNARGVWERTLISSGADDVNKQFTPLKVPIVTADDERVQAEAWWENKGTVHTSLMFGLNKYGGGDFESRRYLEQAGKVLVCESTFHPRDKERDDVKVTWRFLRNGEKYDVGA